MQDGFVPVPRWLFGHEVFDYDDLWRTITWCWRKANFEASRFRGVAVPVGSFVTGRAAGSDELRCTPSSWYRRMQRLQSMGLIRMEASSEWTMVSVCGYPGCGDDGNCPRAAIEQQTSSDRTADEQRLDTSKETNKPIIYLPSEDRAAGAVPPPKAARSRKAFEAPTVDQVAAYCREKQLAMDPAEFVDHYEANGWKQSGGQPIVSWQATARGWARRQVKFSGGRPAARQPAGSTTNDHPHRPAWRSPAQKPVPRFKLAEIQTAEAFLRAARAQDYHDGSADCDVTSLAAWHMAFRRHCDMTTGQIGRADWNAFLGELAQNMQAIASGGTLDGTFMIPRDWQRAEQDAGHASVVAPPAAVSRSVRVCDGRPA